jgi:hypothetical protein
LIKINSESDGASSDDMDENAIAMSLLFTTTNKSQLRQFFTRKKLRLNHKSVLVFYTGIELRAEDDEIVWMQILKYGQGILLGELFEFSVKDLVRDVGWAKSERNYDIARDCIARLRANDVLALNTKTGVSTSVCLIGNYEALNDDDGKPTTYRTWLDPNLIWPPNLSKSGASDESNPGLFGFSFRQRVR